uniref:Uncharacterized protein n=1 Tax=Anguilla anguilla TaxID=7936 RepID=A0A0E9V6H9_ANGAN
MKRYVTATYCGGAHSFYTAGVIQCSMKIKQNRQHLRWQDGTVHRVSLMGVHV